MKTTYLLPLMVGALGVAVIGLGYRAHQRHGYGPLSVGICAATVMLIGKFVFSSDFMMYISGGSLIVASIWNSWPCKKLTPDLVGLELRSASSPQSTES